MAATLNVTRFYDRLGKLHSHFLKHRVAWGNASVLSLNRGPLGKDEDVFLKSITLHQYLFGYELPETILVLPPTTIELYQMWHYQYHHLLLNSHLKQYYYHHHPRLNGHQKHY